MSTHDWGFPEEPAPTARAQQSRTPFALAIGAAIALLVLVVIIALISMIGTGRDVAEGERGEVATTNQSAETPEPEPDPTQPPEGDQPAGDQAGAAENLAAATTALSELPATTSCSDVDADVATLAGFVNASVNANSWDDAAQADLTAALTGIDEACSSHKSHVLQLRDMLGGSELPPELNALAAGDWITPLAPAPEGAIAIDGAFSSGLGNIWCDIGEAGVSCAIGTYSFAPTCAGAAQSYTITHTAGATHDCTGGPSSGTTLDYGTVVAANDYACEISESGFRCWSEMTGEGLELSRESERFF